jgi:hypothetical protein
MSDEKMLGFYTGIGFVFLTLLLISGIALIGLFFTEQSNNCKDLGYDGIAGIDSCQRTVNYETSHGKIEMKEKIMLSKEEVAKSWKQ